MNYFINELYDPHPSKPSRAILTTSTYRVKQEVAARYRKAGHPSARAQQSVGGCNQEVVAR